MLETNKGEGDFFGNESKVNEYVWQLNKGKTCMLGKAADDGHLVTAIKQRLARHF